MQEDIRLQMIQRINGEKERILDAKGKINRFKELESLPDVQEYLALKSLIDEAAKVDDKVILEREKERMFTTEDCSHDICIFTQFSLFANRSVAIMANLEEKVLDMKATHVEFFCLDCASYISVPLADEANFRANHNIINPNRPLSAITFNREKWNLKNWRNHYFELLLTMPSEEVFETLKQEYEEESMSRKRK